MRNGLRLMWCVGVMALLPPLAMPVMAEEPKAQGTPANGLITLIAPDAQVVLGEKASPGETRAANLIVKALHEGGGPEDNLRKAEAVDKPDAAADAGRKHLIVVGTVASNPVLRHYPGTWFLDREAYYSGVYAGGYDPAQGKPRETVRDWQEKKGFFVGGFGTFRADGREAGYIECDRSEFFMWARNLAGDSRKPHDQQLPLRLMIRITGSSPAGVEAAAKAFVEKGLLGGIAPVEPKPSGAATKRTILSVGSDDLGIDPPAEPPDGKLKGEGPAAGKSLTRIGWVQADAQDYDGFLQQTGVPAVRMWRVKYVPETGITNFVTSPHRRNSIYELLVVDLPAGTDRSAVLKGLKATEKYEIAGQTFAATAPVKFKDPLLAKIALASGTHVLWKGDRLYLESLPPVYEDILLAALAHNITGGGK